MRTRRLYGSRSRREITWRCWWDGGTGGPITTAWGVASFPLIYVLDGEGVIRFKPEAYGEELDRAVDTLMKPRGAEENIPRFRR